MDQKTILYKVVAFVNREELDFLDKVVKDLFFATGKKVPRSELIKEIIHLSQEKNIKEEIMHDLNKEVRHE